MAAAIIGDSAAGLEIRRRAIRFGEGLRVSVSLCSVLRAAWLEEIAFGEDEEEGGGGGGGGVEGGKSRRGLSFGGSTVDVPSKNSTFSVSGFVFTDNSLTIY
ncbi:hypothetical protein NL676_002073 [Syzygium grande]|nr:hypothetical protein NL676_002073 [Syzygium grande]